MAITAASLGACSGGGDTGGGGDGDSSMNDVESTWGAAEGKWMAVERAITSDCEASLADLTFIAEDAAEQRCGIFELGDYDGTAYVSTQDCENGMDPFLAYFELGEDGRMLDEPFEYFQDGGMLPSGEPYWCDFSRSQYELVLVEGEPFIVFWVWDASLEGVTECPEELPEGTEITCIKDVSPLIPAGG